MPDEERRTLQFRVRLNAMELDLIRRAATDAGISAGPFVRRSAVRAAAARLGVDPPPE